ncbi:MAG: SH3 domain-containing protein [Dehalococcoidia bacterium]|nr:SH3 domain-containing protein [Dehalococcoidia bacterium]
MKLGILSASGGPAAFRPCGGRCEVAQVQTPGADDFVTAVSTRAMIEGAPIAVRKSPPLPVVRALLGLVIFGLVTSLATVGTVVHENEGPEWQLRWTPGTEAVIVDAWGGVRIRATPGLEGRTIGALKTGEPVRILEGPESVAGEQWVKVSWSDGSLAGWLPLRYVE